MVKLSEGDDIQQLRIEVHGVLAYCMNIKECMTVEVEADGKPWYHNTKAYIKNSEYLSGAPYFYVFMSNKRKKKEQKQKKYKKVDQKLERAVYTKGEPKERECEKIKKVD